MKFNKAALLIMPAAIIALLVSFSTPLSNYIPKESAQLVATRFLAALDNADLAHAKKYVKEDQQSALDLMTGSEESFAHKGYQVVRTTVDNSNAYVKYRQKNGDVKTLNLVMVDGSWKVDFNKADFMDIKTK